MANEVTLEMDDLREIAAYAAESAGDVLKIFEQSCPSDARPREAIDTAWTFARGGKRSKALRDAALAALKAANECGNGAAGQAARAAMCAASAAYLHPLARATQVRHILGAAAHAARAFELVAGDVPNIGADYIERASRRASPKIVEVLRRYPPAPSAGGRVGELLRLLDGTLRDVGF